jgi:hypothetical protein
MGIYSCSLRICLDPRSVLIRMALRFVQRLLANPRQSMAAEAGVTNQLLGCAQRKQAFA